VSNTEIGSGGPFFYRLLGVGWSFSFFFLRNCGSPRKPETRQANHEQRFGLRLFPTPFLHSTYSILRTGPQRAFFLLFFHLMRAAINNSSLAREEKISPDHVSRFLGLSPGLHVSPSPLSPSLQDCLQGAPDFGESGARWRAVNLSCRSAPALERNDERCRTADEIRFRIDIEAMMCNHAGTCAHRNLFRTFASAFRLVRANFLLLGSLGKDILRRRCEGGVLSRAKRQC
jgi:hypothetical protein